MSKRLKMNLQLFATGGTIYDVVTAKEIGTYYTTATSNRIPYLGEVLFPRKKQLGLDLSWIKGSKGLPIALKPAAFDTKVTLRDRVGMEKLETEMPFFKEGILIKEKDRQELNKILSSGNQAFIDLIVNNIFDDVTGLVDGALAQEERLRMQLLSTGMIAVTANGMALDYDFKMPATHKVKVTVPWSQVDTAIPIQDMQGWMDLAEEDTGTRPTRAICSRKTWNYLIQNKSIKLDLNATSGDKIIMTDSMLSQYIEAKVGLKIQVYSKKYKDEFGVAKSYFPDDTITLIPEGNLGNTYFGTTPEESDLMSGGTDAQVSIVNTGMAITTSKQTDPVNVETKVSMICLPSFEQIDKIIIADVITTA